MSLHLQQHVVTQQYVRYITTPHTTSLLAQSIAIVGDMVIRSDFGINMTAVIFYVEGGATVILSAPTVTLGRGKVGETALFGSTDCCSVSGVTVFCLNSYS